MSTATEQPAPGAEASRVEPRIDVPAPLSLVLLAVLLLECLVALHTLAPKTSAWSVVFISALATATLGALRARPMKAWELRFNGAFVLGLAAGEAVAYFLQVPWGLTLVCFHRARHDVAATMFLRYLSVMLAWAAWTMSRRAAEALPGTPSRGRAAPAAGLLAAATATLPVAVIPLLFTLVQGHRPHSEVEAEERAAVQLGPEYAGYRYFVRELDSVFRRGESVTTYASLIAYDSDLTDLLEVQVTWKEPWTSREPRPAQGP